jgi:hypothetical protein
MTEPIDFMPHLEARRSREARKLRCERRWETLCDAHEQEAERLGAEFHNYGWVQNTYDICSKTSVGYLSSYIDQNGNVTHEVLKKGPLT